MKVLGYEVSKEQLEACQAVMRRPRFNINTLTVEAEHAGIPQRIEVKGKHPDHVRSEALADRVADRLIQKARKEGKIVRSGRDWVPSDS